MLYKVATVLAASSVTCNAVGIYKLRSQEAFVGTGVDGTSFRGANAGYVVGDSANTKATVNYAVWDNNDATVTTIAIQSALTGEVIKNAPLLFGKSVAHGYDYVTGPMVFVGVDSNGVNTGNVVFYKGLYSTW
jgi:hypothetical protein